MEFYVGTSRFYDIVDHFWYEEGQPGQAIGGGKIEQLVEEALGILSITGYERRRDSLVYVGGGLPDITTKYKERNYQEVVCVGEPDDIVEEVIGKMEVGAERIASAGGVPIFCTVTPMDIARWNQTRLARRKTKYLRQEYNYGIMQEKHEDIVIELNRRIDSLNQQYHMQTPRLGAIVFPKRGALGGYRFRRDRLSADGCHLTDFTTQKWIDLLKTNADTNRHRFYTNYNEDFSDNDLADISTDKIDYEIDTLSNISDISTTPSGRGLELHYNEIEGYARLLCLSQGLVQV